MSAAHKLMSNIERFVKNSLENNRKHYFLFENTTVVVKDPLTANFELNDVFIKLAQKIPENYLDEIDGIYIGQFDILNDREVNALYLDGVIYVTNVQNDVDDILDDIVHEIAHALEEKYPHKIYEDGLIENEFLGKRRRLEALLRAQNIDTLEYDFDQTEYSSELDTFFYQDVGYPLLTTLSRGLFVSPYGTTSLREYFSNGFEEFYLGDANYLKQVSPKLFEKIYLIHQIGE